MREEWELQTHRQAGRQEDSLREWCYKDTQLVNQSDQFNFHALPIPSPPFSSAVCGQDLFIIEVKSLKSLRKGATWVQWNCPFGPSKVSSPSIPDALMYSFSHITLSHSTFLLLSPGQYYLSNISFLLLLMPVHPYCNFLYFPFFFLPWKSLPPVLCASASSTQAYISK